MNSRDRLSTCSLKTDIEKALEEELKIHPGLKILKDKRRQEEIESKLQNSQPLVEVLENLLKSSPTLSRLFLQGLKLKNPFNIISSAKEGEYKGNEFPSFFTLTKKYPSNNPKQAHLESKCRVEFKTDVSNDYFDRSKDPGTFKLYINGKESEDVSINLWNGFAHLNVLIQNYKVDDILNFRSEVFDVSRYEPIVEEFTVKVIEPLKKASATNGERKSPSSNKDGNESKRQDGFAIPNIIEVSKDGRTGHKFDEQNFDDSSALKVKGSDEDGYDFFVNIDNINLLTELKSANNSEVKALEAKYKFGLVLIGIALLQNNIQKENNEEENVFELIVKVTKAISPIIIPMIDSLGAIEIENIMAMPEEAF